MMRMPVAEVTQRPLGSERLTQLPQIIDVEPEMRVAPLGLRSSLCRKKHDGGCVPAAENVSAGFDRPCGCLDSDRAELGFPDNERFRRRARPSGCGRRGVGRSCVAVDCRRFLGVTTSEEL